MTCRLHGLGLAAYPFLLLGPTAQCGLSTWQPDLDAQDSQVDAKL